MSDQVRMPIEHKKLTLLRDVMPLFVHAFHNRNKNRRSVTPAVFALPLHSAIVADFI